MSRQTDYRPPCRTSTSRGGSDWRCSSTRAAGRACSGCIPAGAGVARGSLDGVAPRDRPASAELDPREPDSVSFTATAAYPYVDRDRATAGLRGQLRGIVAGAGAGVPDWTTLVVEGPTAIKGLHRRVWFV